MATSRARASALDAANERPDSDSIHSMTRLIPDTADGDGDGSLQRSTPFAVSRYATDTPTRVHPYHPYHRRPSTINNQLKPSISNVRRSTFSWAFSVLRLARFNALETWSVQRKRKRKRTTSEKKAGGLVLRGTVNVFGVSGSGWVRVDADVGAREGALETQRKPSPSLRELICTEAGMYALRERRQHVTQEDFEFAVAKVLKKNQEGNTSVNKLFS
ncbi:hypothetical protein AB1N83_008259 [Pleurotus pulmonarius]